MTAARKPYPPRLLSREDAADYLSISARKLDELQAQGRVIPKALDGRRVYLRDDLDAFARALPDWTPRTAPH